MRMPACETSEAFDLMKFMSPVRGKYNESDDIQARHPYGYGVIADIDECARGAGAAGCASADGAGARGARAGADHRLADSRHGRGRRPGDEFERSGFPADRRIDYGRSVPH